LALLLAACGGGGGGATPAPVTGGGGGGGTGTAPPPPPVIVSTEIESKAEAADFYAALGFGGKEAQLDSAIDKDAAQILREEFDKPRNSYLPRVQTLYESYAGNGRRNTSHRTIFWKDLISRDDQLRQRMVFALSQIIVASDKSMSDKPTQMAYYMDILSENAFGNYRDLLEDITYSPAMGEYLTYRGNRKGDTKSGRTPDENYARELLQLFSIGLVELNMNGTTRLGSDGLPIETYNNDDIVGLARVFTGLDLEAKSDKTYDPVHPRRSRPMAIYEDRHETLEKTFLGETIPANTSARESIDQALDIIFEHPNVAPFISRQLIQRFTASSPDPDYVERVARVFESGTFTAANNMVFGNGQRGDLEATLAAILLDESQHTFDGTIRNSTDLGKIREPVLNFVHWARAFNVNPVTPENEWDLIYNAGNVSDRIGQMPLSSASVFNFYRPGYIASGTTSGAAGYTAPEFQIYLAGNRAGYVNMMSHYVFDTSGSPDNDVDSFKPNYTKELTMVEDPEGLADHLNELLMSGRMSDATRQAIVTSLPDIEIRTGNASQTEKDKFNRVALAITIAVTAPEYLVR